MTTEIAPLRDLAATWNAKAKAAQNLRTAMKQPDGPYQGARFSPYHGTQAVFLTCADAAAYLTKAVAASEKIWREQECTDHWTLTDLTDFTTRIADYHRTLDQAVNAVRRAMIVEDTVEAGKLAAVKSEAAIAEEIEAVWSIRNAFCGNDVRAPRGVP